jgi:hypothetical protein
MPEPFPSPPSPSFPLSLSNTSRHLRAPSPIASATIALLEEEPLHSTDELILLLESWLKHLGWLWIIEYLSQPACAPDLERLLFRWILDGERELSVGTWAYLGSTFQHGFAERGWLPKQRVLLHFSYGSPHDTNSPLSRLLRYRNSFAHGSFAAVLQDILEHRNVLWSLIAPMEELSACPLIAWDTHSQRWCTIDGLCAPVDAPPPTETGQQQIRIRLAQNEFIDVTDFFRVSLSPAPAPSTQIRATLAYTSLKKASREERIRLLSRHQPTANHLRQFQDLREGLLDFESELAKEPLPHMETKQRTALLATIQQALLAPSPRRPRMVTIMGYPGSGKSGILGQASQLFQGFDHICMYSLRFDDLTSSSVTFARFLLRKWATWYNKPEWLHRNKPILQRIQHALQTIQSSPAKILIGIDQFHLAYRAYEHEEMSIAELVSNELDQIPGDRIAFLMTARPGYREDMLGDEVFSLPIAEDTRSEKYHRYLQEIGLNKRHSILGISPREVHFRNLLLYLLANAPRALNAFEMCDVLAKFATQFPQFIQQSEIFTPRVERALWELRPLLTWERKQIERQEQTYYKPFCQHFREWCAKELFPFENGDNV